MEQYKKIIMCLLMANKPKIAKYNGGYVTPYDNTVYNLSPLSFVDTNKHPKNIIYDELFIASGVGTLNIVTKIPSKLLDFAKSIKVLQK